jgi:hypothetical protein
VRAQLAFGVVALFLVVAAASSAAAAPSMSVNDASVTEGDSGSKNATFTVSLSAASATPVTVDYATADGSATAPDDYATAVGTLTFAPGEVSKQVTVAVAGDTLDEPHETFSLELSNPSGATLGRSRGLGTILDNDPLVSVSVDDPSAVEGTGSLSFTVSLSARSGKLITLSYATVDGTATAPADYGSKSGTLVFLAGELSKSVDVAVVDDQLVEGDETLALSLSNVVNASLAHGPGTGTILDDDSPPPPPPPPGGDPPPPPPPPPDENPPPPPGGDPPPPDQNPPPPDENPPPPADDPPPPPGGDSDDPPVLFENVAPDCSGVAPSKSLLWPPNHKFRYVSLGGARDSDGDPLLYTFGAVTQDEAVGGRPDARWDADTGGVWLRAERSGKGDGRVYRIEYTVSDDHGHSCGGTASVVVPHDRAHAARDSGGEFNSFGF